MAGESTVLPVLIADIRGAQIIERFYRQCGLETIGPGGASAAGTMSRFTSLEDLFDKLLAGEPSIPSRSWSATAPSMAC